MLRTLRLLSGCCDKNFRFITSHERTIRVFEQSNTLLLDIPLLESERHYNNNKTSLQIFIDASKKSTYKKATTNIKPKEQYLNLTV
jgi:hypothetical protein